MIKGDMRAADLGLLGPIPLGLGQPKNQVAGGIVEAFSWTSPSLQLRKERDWEDYDRVARSISPLL
jgi:hypothetical protein